MRGEEAGSNRATLVTEATLVTRKHLYPGRQRDVYYSSNQATLVIEKIIISLLTRLLLYSGLLL